MHWTLPECENAFGWSLDDWLLRGGYPGAAALAGDESLWRRYVTDSLVEAVLARDVMTGSAVRQRASSPKLVLWNNALIYAMSRRTVVDVRADAAWRGRLVENAVGAHLLCHLPTMGCSVHYWREGNAEVDFVVARPGKLWALEVKSGRGGKTPGLPAFRKRFPEAKALLIGGGGVPLEEFFHHHPDVWFGSK